MLMEYICALFINQEYVYLCSFHPIVWTDTKIDARRFYTERELLEEVDEIKDKLKLELHDGDLYILGVKDNIAIYKKEIDLENIIL